MSLLSLLFFIFCCYCRYCVLSRAFETGPVYSKFRAIAKRVNDLVLLVARPGRPSGGHALHLDECYQAYFDARLSLLRPAVQSQLDAMSKDHGLMRLARVGSSYLARLCHLERQLFLAFYDSNSASPGGTNSDHAYTAGLSVAETTGTGARGTKISEEKAGVMTNLDNHEAQGGLHVMLVDLCNTM